MTSSQFTPADIKRFWSKVHTQSLFDCWIWTAYLDKDGYGKFTFIQNRKQRKIGAHRISLCLAFGHLCDEMLVCHTCDVNYPISDTSYRRCVNPAHLHAATNDENMAHMAVTGRVSKGDRHAARLHPETHWAERNAATKLTAQQVMNIRSQYESGEKSRKVLAIENNISISTIDSVITRKTWVHIP